MKQKPAIYRNFRLNCALQVLPTVHHFVVDDGFRTETAFNTSLPLLKQDTDVITITNQAGIY